MGFFDLFKTKKQPTETKPIGVKSSISVDNYKTNKEFKEFPSHEQDVLDFLIRMCKIDPFKTNFSAHDQSRINSQRKTKQLDFSSRRDYQPKYAPYVSQEEYFRNNNYDYKTHIRYANASSEMQKYYDELYDAGISLGVWEPLTKEQIEKIKPLMKKYEKPVKECYDKGEKFFIGGNFNIHDIYQFDRIQITKDTKYEEVTVELCKIDVNWDLVSPNKNVVAQYDPFINATNVSFSADYIKDDDKRIGKLPEETTKEYLRKYGEDFRFYGKIKIENKSSKFIVIAIKIPV